MEDWDWSSIAVFGSAAAVVSSALWWRHVMGKHAAKAFAEAAREVGLTFAPGRPGSMSGTVNDIEIAGADRPNSGSRGKDGYRFRVEGLPPISLRGEGFPASRDVKTGDAAFDRAFRLDGDEAIVLAVLDAHAREVLAKHVRHYGGTLLLEQGVLSLEYLDLPTKTRRIVTDIHAVREVAEAVGTRYRRKGRVRCLAENAMTDPEREVRIRSLEVLLEVERNEFSLAAFHAAAMHPDPELRLLGAIGAGREGDVKAIALTSAMAPAIRGRALRRLVKTLEREDAETLLLGVSRESLYPELMHVVLESLGRVGSTRSVERLLEIAGSLTATGRLASSAIDQIQGRLAWAAPGQLSIAMGEGGAVSLAQAPGALSHAKKTGA